MTDISNAEIRQAAIAVGIPADDVDRMLGPEGLMLLVRPGLTVSLKVVVEKDQEPGRCADPDCDGEAGHTGQHFQWVPE